MQSSAQENNKRIAKNTMFLYFRSILILFVGFYTTREVLTQLGVEDFGIYNIVGGVIVLFSFIQSAMNSATSRFFTFDLGKGDYEQLKKTFSLSVIIHVCTALIILILGETVGLWFLNTQLVIPEERMEAANFVYQFTIFTACIGILQMPYTVAINAHERMKVYAYAGIAEAVFKLAVVLALGLAPFDKLKIYAVLLFSVYVVMCVFYRVYCHRNFPETHFKWFWDKKMFLERIGFSGWTTLGGISGIAVTHGGNMMVNVFYGVTVNSAIALSYQISNASNIFTSNFLAAVNPQIIKLYAQKNLSNLTKLIFRSSKFCFFLCFIFIAPLCIQMDFILNLWLENVPNYAYEFCILSLVNILLCMPFYPIWSTITATGNIKTFQIADNILLFSMLIFIYAGLHYSPLFYQISWIAVNIMRVILALVFVKKLANISVISFCFNVVLKILIISIISLPIPFLIAGNFTGWHGFLFCSTGFLIIFIPSVLFLGLNQIERAFIFSYFQK